VCEGGRGSAWRGVRGGGGEGGWGRVLRGEKIPKKKKGQLGTWKKRRERKAYRRNQRRGVGLAGVHPNLCLFG